MLPGLEGTPNGVPRPTGSVGVSGSNPLCSTQGLAEMQVLFRVYSVFCRIRV